MKDHRAEDQRLAHAAWREQFDRLLMRVRGRIPAAISSQEIEADITAAREEVKQERRVARRR